MNLVIVESPAKAKTINKYLGDNYTVLASYGHIRDLPSKNGSVDPDQNFKMEWEVDSFSKKYLKEITDAAKESSKIIFCGDTRQDDLEGSRNRNDVSGLRTFINVLNRIPSFRTVKFGIEDIVRSGLVKEYIIAKDKQEKQQKPMSKVTHNFGLSSAIA